MLKKKKKGRKRAKNFEVFMAVDFFLCGACRRTVIGWESRTGNGWVRVRVESRVSKRVAIKA